MSLYDRFTSFMDQLPGAEAIDKIKGFAPPDQDRADYLLNERRLVIEIKTFEDSPLPKAEKIIDSQVQKSGIRPYGTLPISSLIKEEADKKAIDRKLYYSLVRNTETICKKADSQFQDTFRALDKLACSLLVVLNDKVPYLPPTYVATRILQYVSEKPRNIHYCLLLFETHQTIAGGSKQPQLLLLDLTRTSRQRRASRYVDSLCRGWAERDGGEYKEAIVRNLDDIAFDPGYILVGR